jgi:hypothetical protein
MLNVAPGGRSSAEVAKAALLGRSVGGPEAAAAGAVMQAATFVAVALVSVVCGVVALWQAPPHATTRWPVSLLFVNAAFLFGLGVGLRAFGARASTRGMARAEATARVLRVRPRKVIASPCDRRSLTLGMVFQVARVSSSRWRSSCSRPM